MEWLADKHGYAWYAEVGNAELCVEHGDGVYVGRLFIAGDNVASGCYATAKEAKAALEAAAKQWKVTHDR